MKYFIMALLMAITISAQSQPKWTKSGHDENVIIDLVDQGYVVSGLSQNDNAVYMIRRHAKNRFWVAEVNSISSNNEYNYCRTLYEMDFSNKRFRRQSMIVIYWDGEQGTDYSTGEWIYPSPGSIGDGIISKAKEL